jgi:hypothetical protein
MGGPSRAPEETSARTDVQSAFLGLGSERSPQEFDNGVTYAVAQAWVTEGNRDTLKILRTGFLVRLQLRLASARGERV